MSSRFPVTRNSGRLCSCGTPELFYYAGPDARPVLLQGLRLFQKRMRVIIVAIGALQKRKHMVSSAWSVEIALSYILFILKFEICIFFVFARFINSGSQAI